MTLNEFFESANLLAQKHSKRDVTVHAMIAAHSKQPSYSISLWVHEQKKFVESGQHKNPEAALERFKDNLELFFKQYDTSQKDMQIV